jgi:hypothetical protein
MYTYNGDATFKAVCAGSGGSVVDLTTSGTSKIAGWSLSSSKFYNGNNIVLDAVAKKVSVKNDAVKMYYTSDQDYGITATGFHLGSTNTIAEFTFTTSRMSKVNTDYTVWMGNDFLSSSYKGFGIYKSSANFIRMISTGGGGVLQCVYNSSYVFSLSASGASTISSFSFSGTEMTNRTVTLSDKGILYTRDKGVGGASDYGIKLYDGGGYMRLYLEDLATIIHSEGRRIDITSTKNIELDADDYIVLRNLPTSAPPVSNALYKSNGYIRST